MAMSGGVDSSVAAALLVEQDFRVIGLTMKLLDRAVLDAENPSDRGCCSLDSIYRAQAICEGLNIPHYSLDMTYDFNQYVISDFISEYISGRTPNPCIRCNSFLKWGVLYEKARKLGCDYLATGHYARIEQSGGEYHLLRAKDASKDQSYALWGIPQEKLAGTLLPLGALTKKEVRRLAAKMGLKSAATPDSQEICFIPQGHYSDFITKRTVKGNNSLTPGDLVERINGEERGVGSHSGYLNYTIGQRKGLGGGFAQPRYVLSIEPESNCIIIGPREELFEKVFCIDQLNWLTGIPTAPLKAEIQIRYRATTVSGTIIPQGDIAEVHLDQPAEAITPGQSAVLYAGNRLLGGGRIMRILRSNAYQRSIPDISLCPSEAE